LQGNARTKKEKNAQANNIWVVKLSQNRDFILQLPHLSFVKSGIPKKESSNFISTTPITVMALPPPAAGAEK
jgi:hypothetical protein